MKVVDWVSDGETNNCVVSVGGMGGFFRDGMRWKDYIEDIDEAKRPYLEALRCSIVKLGLRFGGDYHQNADDGVPLFEDGTVGSFSFRAWGDLMAAVWSDHENQDYCYMDFYI